MDVWVNQDKAVIRCLYEEKEIVKGIGDYKFNKADKTWVFPLYKLTQIIEHLNVEYSQKTKEIYDQLVIKKHGYHALLNFANKIKSGDADATPEMSDWMLRRGYHKINIAQCYQHQKQAIQVSDLFDSYALFMETGTGKTLAAISLAKLWQCKTMVVAPLSTLENVWKKEISKWSDLRSVILWNNLAAFHDDYDVYIINYEQFKKIHKDPNFDIPRKVQCLIIDESSKLKNNKSQITKTILSYRDKITHRLCLTGTPAPNNLLEYWGQMCFINSQLLGENFYKFRNTYFYSSGYEGFLYRPLNGAKEAIIDNVSKQAFSIRKEDCLDLPERVFEERAVYMDPIQETAYDEMMKTNILEFKGHTTVGANELAKLMKLRQVTAGFTITTSGMPVLISDSKTKALEELLEEIPEDKKVIIWCQFHWEIDRLKKLFGDKCTTLYGVMKQKDKDKSIQDFLDGKFRILVGHPKSGGMGLNFQHICNYMIWFSLSYSQEEYSQACDRIYRSGQKNKCTYFLLLAKRTTAKYKKDRTVDEIIYNAVQNKANLMNECMEMLKG